MSRYVHKYIPHTSVSGSVSALSEDSSCQMCQRSLCQSCQSALLGPGPCVAATETPAVAAVVVPLLVAEVDDEEFCVLTERPPLSCRLR